MDDLVPVLVGGLIAFLGGLVGAAIQGRREHRRWLRERRYEAFVSAVDTASIVRSVATEVVDLVNKVRANEIPPDKHEATAARLTERMAYLGSLGDATSERMAPLVILGPKSVSDAYVAIVDAMGPPESMDLAKVNAAESALSDAMRKALDIKDY